MISSIIAYTKFECCFAKFTGQGSHALHIRYLGPNLLILSFSSGASPAHNTGRWVLPLFSQQILLTKEVDKRDSRMIICHFCHCVLLDAVQYTDTTVSVTWRKILHSCEIKSRSGLGTRLH